MTKEHNNASQTDWRELCRRLYVELWHCDKQMTSGARPKWKQGPAVRDVLRDANLALEATPAAATAPASTQDEPFGYFRPDAFGWTDCAETDEGAIALYERPAAPAVPQCDLASVTEIETVIDWCVTSYMPMPSNEHAALLVDRLRHLRATPAAPSQPVTLTNGLIEKGAMTGMVDAQIDAIITALREKGKA